MEQLHLFRILCSLFASVLKVGLFERSILSGSLASLFMHMLNLMCPCIFFYKESFLHKKSQVSLPASFGIFIIKAFRFISSALQKKQITALKK